LSKIGRAHQSALELHTIVVENKRVKTKGSSFLYGEWGGASGTVPSQYRLTMSLLGNKMEIHHKIAKPRGRIDTEGHQ
jgi:hypothetical protein